MRRTAVFLVALGLLAAACGGAQTTATSEPSSAPSETAPAPTSDAPSDPGTQPSATTGPTSAPSEAPPATTSGPSFDGPPAPDFALALETGGEFSLSGEAKPIYMVFWAEW